MNFARSVSIVLLLSLQSVLAADSLAIKNLEDSLSRFPDDPGIRYRLAHTYIIQQNFERVIDLCKSSLDDTNTGSAKLFILAKLRIYDKKTITQKFLGNDLAVAVSVVNRLLEKRPGDPDVHFLKGIANRLAERPVEAEIVYRDIIKKQPVLSDYLPDVWLEYSTLLAEQQRFKENDALLKQRFGSSADGAAMLQLAQSAITIGRDAEATRLFYNGLARIRNENLLDELFNDARPIAEGVEIAAWLELKGPESKKKFLTNFWRTRAPDLTDSVDQRLILHYRRLLYARTRYRKITPPYFDDRGLLFVRMGAPDRLFAGSGNDESWVYESANSHYDFIDVGGGYYELRPLSDALSGSPSDQNAQLQELISERRDLHPYYERMYQSLSRNGFWNSLQTLYVDAANQNMKQSFITDNEVEIVPLEAGFSAFRGDSSKTRLDLYYQIPRREWVPGLRIRSVLFDENYLPAAELNRECASPDTNSYVVDEIRLLLTPGNYHLGVTISDDQGKRNHVYRADPVIHNHSGSRLQVSDVQAAASIIEGREGDRFTKPGTRLRVLPNPSDQIIRGQPLQIYFEIYGLSQKRKKTSYEISYEIEKVRKPRNLLSWIGRIFSSEGTRITSVTQKSGFHSTEQEYISFDVNSWPAGENRLTVHVKDLNNEAESSSSLNFYIKN